MEEASVCPRCRKQLVEVGDGRILECPSRLSGKFCGYPGFDSHLGKEVVPQQRTEEEVDGRAKANEMFVTEYDLGEKYAEEVFRQGAEEPEFAVYDQASGTIEYLPRLLHDGLTIRPRPYPEKERKCVWLPDGVEEYGNLKALRRKIRVWSLLEYDPMGNEEEFDLFLSHGLLSWLPEIRSASVESFYPVFRTLGPSEGGKKRYLTIARHIFRRPFYAQKSNRIPSIFRGLEGWPGSTLILDEADSKGDFDTDLLQFLNSRADGVPIPRYDADHHAEEFIWSQGYSILAVRFPYKDTGIESRCITQPAVPTSDPKKYDLIPPPEWVEEGRQIMRQLLMFRFRNRTKKFSLSYNLDIEDVGPRVRLTLLLLHALKDEDPGIVNDYIEVGKRLEAKLRESRAASDEGLVLNALYGAIEQENDRLENVERDGSNNFITIPNVIDRKFRQPLTGSVIAEQLSRAFSARDVETIWRGLGQSVKARLRYTSVATDSDGQELSYSSTYRGILLIRNPKRLAQEFRRFVPGHSVSLVSLVSDICPRQATLDKGILGSSPAHIELAQPTQPTREAQP